MAILILATYIVKFCFESSAAVSAEDFAEVVVVPRLFLVVPRRKGLPVAPQTVLQVDHAPVHLDGGQLKPRNLSIKNSKN